MTEGGRSATFLAVFSLVINLVVPFVGLPVTLIMNARTVRKKYMKARDRHLNKSLASKGGEEEDEHNPLEESLLPRNDDDEEGRKEITSEYVLMRELQSGEKLRLNISSRRLNIAQ